MKKKTRKAIVFSVVYLLISWIPAIIISDFIGGFEDEAVIVWLIFSIPVVIYWAKKFIDAGND
jgi:hypothetical protein